MPPLSTPDLCAAIRETALLDPRRQDELTRELLPQFSELKGLANELLRRGWLTPFQLNKIASGRAGELILGPYVLLSLLGEGGMGKVFKAEHRRLKRPAALKIIKPEHLAAPGAVEQFHREAEAAARLDHPNIVRVYDANEASGVHFIAMEYIEGTDLARLIKEKGPLPVATACDYARQVALGLEHAHTRGLIHRDVKPSNLLLGAETLVVKILDLGIARLDRSMQLPAALAVSSAQQGATNTTSTASGSLMIGTPDFVAPEQARDARRVDARADIYSLGCSLYFLLVGRPPFQGASSVDILLRRMTEDPPAVEAIRDEIPGELGAVVRKLMARRPEDRYATAGEAAAALAPFAGNRSMAVMAEAPGHFAMLQAPPTSTGSRVLDVRRFRQPGRRRMVIASVLVGLGGLAVLLTALSAMTPSDSKNQGALAVVAPSDRTTATTKPADSAAVPSAGAERQAATQLLGLGARLEVVLPGEEKPTPVTTADKLPPGTFRVTQVDLTDLKLTDADLAPLKDLPSLRSLNAAGTRVKGSFLKLFPRTSELGRLNLAGTDVADQGLRHIAALANLQWLDLSKTTVTDEGLHSLAGLRKLKTLHLDDTPVGDKGLEALANVPELTTLTLGGCQVTDAGLAFLKRYRHLQILQLDNLPITDTGLEQLASLSLSQLRLHNTPMTDKGLEHLYPLTHLEQLVITRTSVSVEGVERFRKRVPGCKVESDAHRRPPGGWLGGPWKRLPRDMGKPPG